jgi:hypothetical protein
MTRAGLLQGSAAVCGLLAGGVLAGAVFAEVRVVHGATDSQLHVEVDDESVTLQARSARLGDVLDAIAREAGLEFVSDAALNERLTLQLERVPLAQALSRILDERSFVLKQVRGSSGELWVFGDPAAPLGLPRARRAVSPDEPVDLPAPATAALSDPVPDVRAEAVQALASPGTPNSVPMLKQALSDADEEVREAAVDALGDIGDEESVAALAEQLKGADIPLAIRAIEALGAIGEAAAIRVLRHAAVQGEQSAIREAAADALEELGEPASSGRAD